MSNYSVDYFLFAENVLPGENGKQTAVNIFDEIYAPNMPIVQGLLSLAVKLNFEGKKPKLGSTIHIKLQVIDPDGNPIGNSTIQEFTVDDEKKDGITLGVGANGMPIEKHGDHMFNILINDKLVASKALKVKKKRGE